jgi:DNA-binding Lrp family transcriptional regulator
MALHGLDRIDGEILEILQNQARMPNKEMAQRVGVAPSTCLERVRRLMDEGVLLGFRGEVSPQALGASVQALVSVRLAASGPDKVEAFYRHALRLQEVVTVFQTAGPFDLVLHVAVRDTDHLRELTVETLGSRPEVGHTECSVLLRVDRASHVPDYASRRDAENARHQRDRELEELERQVKARRAAAGD